MRMDDISAELRNTPSQSNHVGDVGEIYGGKSVDRESVQDLSWSRLRDGRAQNDDVVPHVLQALRQLKNVGLYPTYVRIEIRRGLNDSHANSP